MCGTLFTRRLYANNVLQAVARERDRCLGDIYTFVMCIHWFIENETENISDNNNNDDSKMPFHAGNENDFDKLKHAHMLGAQALLMRTAIYKHKIRTKYEIL